MLQEHAINVNGITLTQELHNGKTCNLDLYINRLGTVYRGRNCQPEHVARRMNQLRYTVSAEVYLHDSYFEIGGWRIGMTPQYWSVALLFLGIVMIVVALAAILRS